MKNLLLTALALTSATAFAQQSFTVGFGVQTSLGRHTATNPDYETHGGHSWSKEHTVMAMERRGGTFSIQGLYTYKNFFVPATLGLQGYHEQLEGDRRVIDTRYTAGYYTTTTTSSHVIYDAQSTYFGVSTGIGFNAFKVNRKNGGIGIVARINPGFDLSRSMKTNSVSVDSSIYNSYTDSTTYGSRNYGGASDFIDYPSEAASRDLLEVLRPSLGLIFTTEMGERFGLSFEFDYLIKPYTHFSFGEIDLQYRSNFQFHLTYYLFRKD